MAYKGRCYNCRKNGHIKEWCPTIQCHRCRRTGHIAVRCPGGQQTQSIPGRCAGGGRRGGSGQARAPVMNPAAADAMSTHSKDPVVQTFFQQHPAVGKSSWLGCSFPAANSRRASSGSPPPVLPVMDTDMVSNIRAVETVKRVAETIYKVKGGDSPPLQILRDKQFLDFCEENNSGLLFIPKDEKDQEKGDFDIIILHPVYGYIHLEIKAFGDVQEDMTDEEKMPMMKDVFQKAVKPLQKGRRALQCLQPPGERVGIVNTLALPNVTRDFLRRALHMYPDMRQSLEDCIMPSGGSTVELEELCLCSDDLPPKDGVVDETDPSIRNAICTWWSSITAVGASNTRPSSEAYRLIMASFFNNEDIKSFCEYVRVTGDRFQQHCLDKDQAEAVKSPHQYMYICGLPGSGKTLVLAEKAVQLLREGRSVFILYTHRKIPNQPATEFLWHFIQAVAGNDVACDLPHLYKLDFSKFSQLKDVLTEVQKIVAEPSLGQYPRTPMHRPEDTMFEEVSRTDVKLDEVFTTTALIQRQEESQEAGDRGENICIIVDEFHMRVFAGESKELPKAIKKRFPAAKIWCAGQFPSHRPGKSFHTHQLFLPYRCTPKTQRLLQALEPFCHSEEQLLFKYVTSSTRVHVRDVTPSPDYQHRLADDGPDPVFFSHGAHGMEEIYNCAPCAAALTVYLTDVLRIGQTDSSGKGLADSDVLIVVSSTALYNNMQKLVHTQLYRHLTREDADFRVNVYNVADTFDLHKPGICIMHARQVGGMEKKVVVSIPCKQYQAKQMTYAEALRTSPPSPAPSQGRTASPAVRDHQGTKHRSLGLVPDQNVPKQDPATPAVGLQRGSVASSTGPTPTTQPPDQQGPAERPTTGGSAAAEFPALGHRPPPRDSCSAAPEADDGQRHARGAEDSLRHVRVFEGNPLITGGIEGNPLITGGIEGNPLHAGGIEDNPLHAGGIEGNPLHAGGIEGNPLITGGIEGNPLITGGIEANPLHAGGIEGNPLHAGGIEGNPLITGGIEGNPLHLGDTEDSQQILQRCQTLTRTQEKNLARLGRLNLHWLWYSVSRSLAHNVIFHF
ncbi:hypothetical protein ACOMHN_040530 [Nucella lapillus]